MTEAPRDEGEVLVDGHVHLHPCFDVVSFLDASAQNVRRHAVRPEVARGVLMLAETEGERAFERIVSAVPEQQGNSEGWVRRDTGEAHAIELRSESRGTLLVVAGRQVETREGLEVLALGTRAVFPKGLAAADLIVAVTEKGALPVVPWGFGKWMGRRRYVVRSLLDRDDLPPFFLGDNGNRPRLWRMPSLFAIARERGVPNLPGSDPLPFREEYRRAGSYGVRLPYTLPPEKPARALSTWLKDRRGSWQTYGHGETPLRFLRNQVGMQYQKLRRRVKPI